MNPEAERLQALGVLKYRLIMAGMGVVLIAIVVFGIIGYNRYLEKLMHEQQQTCVSHLREIGRAITVYAQDHENKYPADAAVWSSLQVDPSTLVCPTVAKKGPISYGYNKNIAGKDMTAYMDPDALPLAADGGDASHLIASPSDVDQKRHKIRLEGQMMYRYNAVNASGSAASCSPEPDRQYQWAQ